MKKEIEKIVENIPLWEGRNGDGVMEDDDKQHAVTAILELFEKEGLKKYQSDKAQFRLEGYKKAQELFNKQLKIIKKRCREYYPEDGGYIGGEVNALAMSILSDIREMRK